MTLTGCIYGRSGTSQKKYCQCPSKFFQFRLILDMLSSGISLNSESTRFSSKSMKFFDVFVKYLQITLTLSLRSQQRNTTSLIGSKMSFKLSSRFELKNEKKSICLHPYTKEYDSLNSYITFQPHVFQQI